MPAKTPPTNSSLQVAQTVNTAMGKASNDAAHKHPEVDDRELIREAQQGNKQAFRTLVELHQRKVFAVALSMVRDENDATEISQEAFFRVYRSLDQFKGSSSFFTWIYRIVFNLCIDHLRRVGRREAEFVDGRDDYLEAADASQSPLLANLEGSDPFRVARRREIGQRLREALEALPPYHQGVILMREWEGMSYEEMAQAMGVSTGTIMSRLFHARRKLQTALADLYAEERERDASDSTPRSTSGDGD